MCAGHLAQEEEQAPPGVLSAAPRNDDPGKPETEQTEHAWFWDWLKLTVVGDVYILDATDGVILLLCKSWKRNTSNYCHCCYDFTDR